jgi:hypothetical protein
MAEEWAEMMAKNEKLYHSPVDWRVYKKTILGENVCLVGNMSLTGEKMVDLWYAESQKHDYALDHQEYTQNFSQMIWKQSKEVGFGRFKNGDTWYGVALYTPPGNITGEYVSNVSPPNTYNE